MMAVRWSGVFEGGVVGKRVTIGVLQIHYFLHQYPPLSLNTTLVLQSLEQLEVEGTSHGG